MVRRSLFYFMDFSGGRVPVKWPATLLPAVRKALRLRPGEQKVHTRRRREPISAGAGKRACNAKKGIDII